MIYAPILGSQVNPRAKLHKRLSGNADATIRTEQTNGTAIRNGINSITVSNNVITIEDNRYAAYCSIAWTEADDMTEGDEQPLDGLPVESARMTIKFHGRYMPRKGAKDEPEVGDVLQIGDDFWIVEAGCQRTRKKSLVNFATVYLPIRKLQ